MNKKQLAGSIIALLNLTFAWIVYDWKLALIIFLALLGNNLERSGRE